ncbi:hypothetical protein B0H15DRAFT_843580 [Mycena belliarum]|uniref:Uncharacterized protein n=1 Tax=Mycena belliarum TaxID=1033014 RepID=A0AAD6U331_9AGAR|nr:hypothetical protein B0H15DRAFT_843580 [Mycena belliae]
MAPGDLGALAQVSPRMQEGPPRSNGLFFSINAGATGLEGHNFPSSSSSASRPAPFYDFSTTRLTHEPPNTPPFITTMMTYARLLVFVALPLLRVAASPVFFLNGNANAAATVTITITPACSPSASTLGLSSTFPSAAAAISAPVISAVSAANRLASFGASAAVFGASATSSMVASPALSLAGVAASPVVPIVSAVASSVPSLVATSPSGLASSAISSGIAASPASASVAGIGASPAEASAAAAVPAVVASINNLNTILTSVASNDVSARVSLQVTLGQLAPIVNSLVDELSGVSSTTTTPSQARIETVNSAISSLQTVVTRLNTSTNPIPAQIVAAIRPLVAAFQVSANVVGPSASVLAMGIASL